MSFSQEWEQRYRENTHMSVWPWSDVVSFVMRHSRPSGKPFRVLELGCGAGANIPFFLSLGAEYHTVEGSPTIVGKLHESFPALTERIVLGDFTHELPFDCEFDLVLDRAAVTFNRTEDIVRALALAYSKLRQGGIFIGIDWYSTAYSDFSKGLPTEDVYARSGYVDGSFANTGLVHFWDKKGLLDLFSRFELLTIEHKIIQREFPEDGWNFASWNIAARKN